MSYEASYGFSTSPAENEIAIVPGTQLAAKCRAIYVGTGGNVVITRNGSNRAYLNVASGTILSVRADLIAVSSTAADMLALY